MATATKTACVFAIVLLEIAPVDRSLAMTVQPVVFDLGTSGRSMSQVIAVQNTFASPLPVELRAEELIFDETGAHGSGRDTGDLLVFPPQAVIQPGQTQSFRVQWVGDASLKTSKHYHVTVSQLPIDLPEGQSAIQVLYNFKVLVSVAPQGVKPDIKVIGAKVATDKSGKPVASIVVRNDSEAHGFLSQGRLRLIEKDGQGTEIYRRTLPAPEIQQTLGFGLVGAHQERAMIVPVQLPAAMGSLEAEFISEKR